MLGQARPKQRGCSRLLRTDEILATFERRSEVCLRHQSRVAQRSTALELYTKEASDQSTGSVNEPSTINQQHFGLG